MKYFALLACCAGLLFSSACDMADVREDPNNPTDVPENLQLPALLGYFSYEIIGNEAPRITTLWIQQLAFNGVPPTEDNYDVDESTVNNLWEFYSYTDVMNNARILDERATANGNYAYAAIAKTLLAWNLSLLTDLWGSVPWSEAFDPSNTTPAYDSQEAVYAAIFQLLDEALADYNRESTLAPGGDDLLYGGDMEKWEKMTQTLKARLHMHLTRAPGNSATDRAAQALAALQNGFTSNADDADYAYYSTVGAENPWFQFAIDSKWDTRDQLSAHYVNLLKTRRDPRLPIQARQAGAVGTNGLVPGFTPQPFTEAHFDVDDSTYVGHQNGNNGIGETRISSIGAFYSAPDAPLNWISYAEAKFIEAEATLLTSGPAAADPVYREAIAASMDKLGVAPADRDAYLAARPALTSDNALREIMIEKYIANFLNFEAYNDWRRNGYPELTPATNQAQSSIIPLRFPYPASELARNAANVSATGVPLGYEAFDVPVWWDTTN